MKRHILGVLASTAAAPFLVMAFIACEAVLDYGAASKQTLQVDDLFFTSLGVLYLGTRVLIVLGIPIFLTASVMAFILYVLKARSVKIILGFGLLAGLGCGLFFVSPHFQRDWTMLLSFCVAGVICGWIYWRIAIRQTPKNSHAIDAA